jgi:hypothetical protein
MDEYVFSTTSRRTRSLEWGFSLGCNHRAMVLPPIVIPYYCHPFLLYLLLLQVLGHLGGRTRPESVRVSTLETHNPNTIEPHSISAAVAGKPGDAPISSHENRLAESETSRTRISLHETKEHGKSTAAPKLRKRRSLCRPLQK